jgi:hypothetical protein
VREYREKSQKYPAKRAEESKKETRQSSKQRAEKGLIQLTVD